jgi:serine/threonine protein kinase/tetratricopeptide (TPR) repeat protein
MSPSKIGMVPMIGKQLLHYKILEKIGEGGMGVVYKAEDTRLGRTVALKFMPPEVTRNAKSKQRFIREAQTIAALDHPNLCTIHAIEEAPDGRLFIAMACYEGETLADKIENGPLDIDESIAIAAAVADGMNSAHAKGIVHRDIKPANIFLVFDGPVKLVDFGLAKWQGVSSLTRSGVTLGTAAYMSPEQARGEKVDVRTDVWALGAVLYEMLAGRPAFEGDYEQAIVYSILNTDPEPLSAVRDDVPPALADIVSRALIKQPNIRYQSSEEILVDLRGLQSEGGLTGQTRSASVRDVSVPSIAVLPFVNMSSDPENDYFGDGLAEELINAFAGWPGIRVAARTSAFSFRGKELDVREIGRSLNVDALLEGSVRKSGNRIRITAQLVDTSNGYHLWSQKFDRQMEDVFEVQDEITAIIVDRLKVSLSGELDAPELPPVKRYTRDMEAYNLYLKGLYYWNKLSPDGLEKSYRCFVETLKLDPGFAPAYVGIAMYHQALGYWYDVHPKLAFPAAKAAADKALALDNTLVAAVGGIAVHRFSYDWDMEAAEVEMRRALELDPQVAILQSNYSVFSMICRRFDRALEHAKIAAELDPLSPVIQTWSAMVPAFAGRWLESIEELRKASELEPAYWQPYYHTAIARLFDDDPGAAVRSAERAVELSGGASIALMALAASGFLAGLKEIGNEAFGRLKKRSDETYAPSTFIAQVHHARGEHDLACDCLQKAISDRDPWLLFYSIMPAPLRSDESRFVDPLRAAGLVA